MSQNTQVIDFATLDADALLKAAESQDHGVPPVATVETEQKSAGRPKMDDPTNPAHIVAVTRNSKHFRVWFAPASEFIKVTRKEADKLARKLQAHGETVNARKDPGDILVFW